MIHTHKNRNIVSIVSVKAVRKQVTSTKTFLSGYI